jgi:hypothetical protein
VEEGCRRANQPGETREVEITALNQPPKLMIMVRGVKQSIIINQITTQMGGVMAYPSMGPHETTGEANEPVARTNPANGNH